MNSVEFRRHWSPRLLSVLRIIVGFLMFVHGSTKLFHIPYVERFAHTDLTSLGGGVAGTMELVGGALVFLGLFTRVTAFILSGEMAFAYFMVHAPRGFFPIVNGGELAVLYCFVFLYLSAAGAGPWSVDGIRRRGA